MKFIASRPAPKIYAMILNDQVEAYNLPLGPLLHLHRDIAGRKPGVITKIGLDPSGLGAAEIGVSARWN